MSATELTALLLFCTAMSFSPGPNTTLSTALAANLGLRRALRFCFAVPTGWTLLMLACGLGLGALVLGVPALRWGVKLLGVAYMLWLAWQLAGVSRLELVQAKLSDERQRQALQALQKARWAGDGDLPDVRRELKQAFHDGPHWSAPVTSTQTGLPPLYPPPP